MNASKNLHNFMFSSLLKAPMSFFDKNPSGKQNLSIINVIQCITFKIVRFLGRILNRFSKDIGAVDEILPRTMIDAIQIFAVMIGIFVQVLIINWWIIFAIIVMGILFNVIRKIYISTAQNIKRLEGNSKDLSFGIIQVHFLSILN